MGYSRSFREFWMMPDCSPWQPRTEESSWGKGKDDAELRHNDTRICYKKTADMDTMKYTRRTSHLVHMCHKTYRTRVELVYTQATHLHKCNLCETCAHIQLFAREASGSPHNAKLSYNVIQKWRMT